MSTTSTEPVVCPLCQSQTQFWQTRNGFALRHCSACGFGFATVPNQFDFQAIYEDPRYWRESTRWGYHEDYDQAVNSLLGRQFARRMATITRLRPLPGRLLEVGCAAGYFLELAQEVGWQVEGVELSGPMRRRCTQRVKCPLYPSLREVPSAGPGFDCVAMFEVIEHLTDPLGFLRELHRRMMPGGLLALSTPNFESYGAQSNISTDSWFEPPAHVSYLGPRTLTDCLKRAAFDVVEIERRMDHERPLPAPLAMLMRPLRRGKRLRPRGFVGRLIKAWQLRMPGASYWMDHLVVYARRTD